MHHQSGSSPDPKGMLFQQVPFNSLTPLEQSSVSAGSWCSTRRYKNWTTVFSSVWKLFDTTISIKEICHKKYSCSFLYTSRRILKARKNCKWFWGGWIQNICDLLLCFQRSSIIKVLDALCFKLKSRILHRICSPVSLWDAGLCI